MLVDQQDQSKVKFASEKKDSKVHFSIENIPNRKQWTSNMILNLSWPEPRGDVILPLRFNNKHVGSNRTIILTLDSFPQIPDHRMLTKYETYLKNSFYTYWVRSYLAGKFAYNYWANTNKRHDNYFRSVKLWYDSSLQLERMKESLFNLDQKAKNILMELETTMRKIELQPNNERSVAYRKIIPLGYIQPSGPQFAEAYRIKLLAATHHFERALKLNNMLLKSYRKLSVAERLNVQKYWRIDASWLSVNKQYLAKVVADSRL